MRLKILLLICVLLAVGWFIGTSWIVSSQAIEMRELGERLENVEIIVHREIVNKKIPAGSEEDKEKEHGGMLI